MKERSHILHHLAWRAAGAGLLLLILSVVIFALMGLMPGDPIDLAVQANPELSSEDAARLRAYYGLDQPWHARYALWLKGALSGNFGISRSFNAPVWDVLAPRLLNTLYLVGLSLLLAVALALPLAIIAARRPYGWLDSGINFFCFAGISIPPFWLAMMLILIFAVTLQWLPAGGVLPVGAADEIGLRLRHLILPVTCLTLLTVGDFTRFIRAELLNQMSRDHIRTARAKGLPETQVLLRHALRAALVPAVTVIALSLGTVFSGALITEIVFAYLGMGKLIFDAITLNDYNLAMASLMLASAMVLLGNFLADIAYLLLDPRIRMGAQHG